MPLDVPVVLQPFGSSSCVPTCVYAVLRAFEADETAENGDTEREDDEDDEAEQARRDEVSELCEETELGCDLDTVITGLKQGGYDADWFPSRGKSLPDALKLLRDSVMDPDDPQPVIVSLQTDIRSADDHAVVVRRFLGNRNNTTGLEPMVELMDPDHSRGGIRKLSLQEFGRQWNFAGQRAFTVRPG